MVCLIGWAPLTCILCLKALSHWHSGVARMRTCFAFWRSGVFLCFYRSSFDVVPIRILFGMVGRPRSRLLVVDAIPGEGVRRGSGGPPNLIQRYIYIYIYIYVYVYTHIYIYIYIYFLVFIIFLIAVQTSAAIGRGRFLECVLLKLAFRFGHLEGGQQVPQADLETNDFLGPFVGRCPSGCAAAISGRCGGSGVRTGMK